MLFNSFVFALVFLPAVLLGVALFGRMKDRRIAVAWLTFASLVYYGWWNPNYVVLIVGSIVGNYVVGLWLRNTSPSAGRVGLWLGVQLVRSEYSELQAEFGSLAAFFWSFEPPEATRPAHFDEKTLGAIAQTEASRAMARALKRRGFKFFGPTTAYAFMQSMGIVNDHIQDCDTREVVERARTAFSRPRPKRGALI